ncbi:Adenylate cyclase [Micrococcus lylae]|uniref:Adenylate cyclase n=1 Tax=Micrococcus lylae TaxID=1273 RepID=A0A1R4I6S9_9MICC|nr:CYTH and CHAD domain-containing protein [Micrococcus lylae]SJN15530.1 Adenylate cyclase [Micrococcus lylae]
MTKKKTSTTSDAKKPRKHVKKPEGEAVEKKPEGEVVEDVGTRPADPAATGPVDEAATSFHDGDVIAAGQDGGEDAAVALEAEVTFVLDADAQLPDLSAVFDQGEVREQALRAVYLDTADLLLLRNQVTLRRREGGTDDGWHLKLPADADRLEVRTGLGSGAGRWAVPETHLQALAEHLGADWESVPEAERGLMPVAVLSTQRTEVDLLDASGAVVATLCDDRVEASPSGRAWRELEVELMPGAAPELLDLTVMHLAAQGVEPAGSPSKLGRALEKSLKRQAKGKGPKKKDPAGTLVMAYVAEQAAVIRAREAGVAADAPEAVHKSRVAIRRLRSTLRTFGALFDGEQAEALRKELGWYARRLGDPRDAEVVSARILADLDTVPRADSDGPVKTRAAEELGRRHAQAHAQLVKAQASPRYARLMDTLTEFVAAPPLVGEHGRKGKKVLPQMVADAVALTAETAQQARDAETAQERLTLLHETRKRAKAVRYAFEATAPAFGETAAARAADWEQVTEALGAVQDLEVVLPALRHVRDAAVAAGESSYTYGWLAGRLGQVQAEAEAQALPALEAALRHAEVKPKDLLDD